MQIIRTENREREGREGREEKGTPEPILFLEGVITLARPGAKRKKKVCLQSDYKGEILKVYDGATSFLIVTDLFFLSFFFSFALDFVGSFVGLFAYAFFFFFDLREIWGAFCGCDFMPSRSENIKMSRGFSEMFILFEGELLFAAYVHKVRNKCLLSDMYMVY